MRTLFTTLCDARVMPATHQLFTMLFATMEAPLVALRENALASATVSRSCAENYRSTITRVRTSHALLSLSHHGLRRALLFANRISFLLGVRGFAFLSLVVIFPEARSLLAPFVIFLRACSRVFRF